MAGRVVPFATPEQTLAAAGTAFLAQPSLVRSTAAPMTRPSLGWCTSSAVTGRSRRSPGGGHRCRDRRQARGCADH
jgi:hypothetical protein